MKEETFAPNHDQEAKSATLLELLDDSGEHVQPARDPRASTETI